jgi:glycosyltransferase involved in cell wall biosynthesis
MSISIAIPFYNAEEYLLDAIRSVFAQTYQDWELILIDDGSTDNSLAIAQSIKDPRVRVYSDSQNKKLAGRLNEVSRLAKYEYIARMDADDLMFPERLEVQMKCFISNPDLDIVTTGVYSVLNDLTIKGIRGSNFEYPKYQEILCRKVGITHAALLARKSWYQRNFYDETLSIAQDLDLWIRSSKNNDLKIKSISAPLYIYREENNITKNKLIRAYNNERRMIRVYSETFQFKLLLRSYIKTSAVVILGAFGKINILQERRGREVIGEPEIAAYNEALEKIKNTKIPGIDEL